MSTTTPPFEKVLIANRGEIAVRVARTLRAMGIGVVAVHADPDRDAPHVAAADEAIALRGTTSAETYLRGDAILEAARATGATAIHPGYGFLSENAAFAHACAEAGVVFIGPPPAAIERMGDKIAAKATMEEAKVPVVPGWSGDGDADVETIAAAATDVGYPVLVKAAAGGGGKGMRVVERAEDLPAAVEAARREAGAAFGDARIFLERYLARARHVEVQVLADAHGRCVHLFERECSIQRRHQKIIEEAPSPALDDALRDAMGAAAVRAVTAIGYVNAGTVEFLLDDEGRFYFLEVNTRLQVEHPVTEETVGLDLVRAQVEIAAGAPLPFAQADLAQRGHALECRIYAEDPARGFLPSTGTIERCVAPDGPGVRVDSGVVEGSVVSVHYDPMLAKLITTGATRDEAIARMREALRRYVVLGVTTNIAFLERVLAHDAFVRGALHTGFLDEYDVSTPTEVPDEALLVAALAALDERGPAAGAAAPAEDAGPWALAGPWRNE